MGDCFRTRKSRCHPFPQPGSLVTALRNPENLCHPTFREATSSSVTPACGEGLAGTARCARLCHGAVSPLRYMERGRRCGALWKLHAHDCKPALFHRAGPVTETLPAFSSANQQKTWLGPMPALSQARTKARVWRKPRTTRASSLLSDTAFRQSYLVCSDELHVVSKVF